MTTTKPAPAVPGAATAPKRDTAVDAVRALLLLIVVLLHAGMVGVSLDDAGAPVLENVMARWTPFAIVTWIVQVMPLFFVLGGFSSFTQYTRDRARGVTPGSYIAARMRRLLPTVAAAIVGTAVFLSALTLFGAPADIVQTAGFRIGQPLWFIGVYIGATALVPLMVQLHERAPVLTYTGLATAALAVEASRIVFSNYWLGLINMLFVWVLLQQIGFAIADGKLDRLHPAWRITIAVGALGGIATLMLTGISPADLIAALNPPNVVLVLVGVVQTMVFLTFRTHVRALAARPGIAATVAWVNARSLTIYAWHMLVVVALAGALLFAPALLPSPLSAQWWLLRPAWFAVILLIVGLVAWQVAHVEVRRDRVAALVSMWRAVPAVFIGAGGVVLALLFGAQTASWTLGAALVFGAMLLARGRKPRHAEPAA